MSLFAVKKNSLYRIQDIGDSHKAAMVVGCVGSVLYIMGGDDEQVDRSVKIGNSFSTRSYESKFSGYEYTSLRA